MKKNRKLFTIVLCVVLGLSAVVGASYGLFGSDNSKKDELPSKDPVLEAAKKQERKVLFESSIRERGSGVYVKNTQLGEKEAEINYYNSFEEFKNSVEATNITKDLYDDFWTEHERFKRVPLEESVFAFLENKELNKITINYTFDNKDYKSVVERAEMEKFLKLKFPNKRSLEWEEKNLGSIYDLKTLDQFQKKFVLAEAKK